MMTALKVRMQINIEAQDFTNPLNSYSDDKHNAYGETRVGNETPSARGEKIDATRHQTLCNV